MAAIWGRERVWSFDVMPETGRGRERAAVDEEMSQQLRVCVCVCVTETPPSLCSSPVPQEMYPDISY